MEKQSLKTTILKNTPGDPGDLGVKDKKTELIQW